MAAANLQSKELSAREPHDHHLARISALGPHPSTPFWRSRPSGPGLDAAASMPAWPAGEPLPPPGRGCTERSGTTLHQGDSHNLLQPACWELCSALRIHRLPNASWQAGAVCCWVKPTDEFAMGSSGRRTPRLLAPSRNPWDPEAGARRQFRRRCGGGGRGEAIGRPFGLRTAASIPARLLLRRVRAQSPPTAGLSRWGLVAFASSLDSGGPLQHQLSLDAAGSLASR